MENKKERNEEIQSRREFFKKAAKGALPILGAVILASSPIISKAVENEPMGCYNSCLTSCSGTCSGGCMGCKGTCTGGCEGICGGNCTYTCSGGCSGSCTGGCSGSCSSGNYW